MALSFRKLHPSFAAEVSSVDLRSVDDDQTLAEIRSGMDEYGVLVFRNQPFTDEQQIEFAKRCDGEIHAKTGSRVLKKSRLGTEAVADISNVGEDGQLMPADDRRRLYGLGNRLWHTDASFQDPRGRYSLLSARVVPEGGGPDTQFADIRTAYDTLSENQKDALAGLHVHHSIAHSRKMLGFEFSAEENEQLKGATHPLVLEFHTGRRSLYVDSHSSRIIEQSLPEGRLLLRDLIEHATQPQLIYSHHWQDGDLVIWDNRATLHRARPYDDTTVRREMRRVTTLDVVQPVAMAMAS
jgi:alpha-ketoglutarate-dependent 2,4-dichlorophenoxyacetate dioxygenase